MSKRRRTRRSRRASVCQRGTVIKKLFDRRGRPLMVCGDPQTGRVVVQRNPVITANMPRARSMARNSNRKVLRNVRQGLYRSNASRTSKFPSIFIPGFMSKKWGGD